MKNRIDVFYVEVEKLTGVPNAVLTSNYGSWGQIAWLTYGSSLAQLEEAERIRLEEEARRLAEEAQELERYRSEFFGQLRDVLGDVDGGLV